MRTRTRLALLTLGLAAAGTAVPTAYYVNGPKWATRTVNYYINPANADLSEDAAIAAIQTGATTWGSQSNADFRFYYMGRTSGSSLINNGKNEVFFRNTANGGVIAETYYWWDGSGKLVDADILFYDGGFQFFTGSGCSSGMYVENTAAHEFGHALGLGHSADPEATMYYAASWCSTSGVTLNSDDLAGVETLYPAGSTNTPPSVNIATPGSNSSIVFGTPLTFSGSASDQQDGNLSGIIDWSSSAIGHIGTGASVNFMLPVGIHTITASVSDSGGATASRYVTVAVSAPAPTTPTPVSSINLVASGYRVRQGPRVDLSWSGAISGTVDLYRNGVKIMNTPNDGTQPDSPGKKASGTYTYKMCEAGTSTCSNTVSVVF